MFKLSKDNTFFSRFEGTRRVNNQIFRTLLELDEVCYFILCSDGPKGLFAIHPTNHELMTNQELDRERRSNYHIIIKATEECINSIDEQAAYNDTILDSSELKINVHVNDIDDNPPVFIERVFTGG